MLCTISIYNSYIKEMFSKTSFCDFFFRIFIRFKIFASSCTVNGMRIVYLIYNSHIISVKMNKQLTMHVNDDSLASATSVMLEQHVSADVEFLATMDEDANGHIDDHSSRRTTAQQDGDDVRRRVHSSHNREQRDESRTRITVYKRWDNGAWVNDEVNWREVDDELTKSDNNYEIMRRWLSI